MEFILVVLIIQVPTIWLVPVALLTTVYGRGFSFKVAINKKIVYMIKKNLIVNIICGIIHLHTKIKSIVQLQGVLL